MASVICDGFFFFIIREKGRGFFFFFSSFFFRESLNQVFFKYQFSILLGHFCECKSETSRWKIIDGGDSFPTCIKFSQLVVNSSDNIIEHVADEPNHKRVESRKKLELQCHGGDLGLPDLSCITCCCCCWWWCEFGSAPTNSVPIIPPLPFLSTTLPAWTEWK